MKILENKTYGIIGEPSDWLIASIPDYEKASDIFGCRFLHISLDELISSFKSFDQNIEVDSLNFDKEELKKAEIVYKVLENIINKYHLDGFTLRCFDLLTSIKTTGCLALAKLNQEGIISTCEGDVSAMLSMAIAKEISNNSSFQANPCRIDPENNTILFAHCTIPLDMLSSFIYKTHFESGIGVAIKGELFEKEVTIFRLSSDLKRFFVSKGKILKNCNFNNLCRTQILVKLDKKVDTLLKNPCGNHHIIFYGDYVDKIDELFKNN